MAKKILIVLISLFALTGCFGRKTMKIDFGVPASGPDLQKLTPTTGPNDVAK
jgi:hypothetical protein